jgi:phospholipid/cholesterol/gamma-HCH transport system ATP-binding protein
MVSLKRIFDRASSRSEPEHTAASRSSAHGGEDAVGYGIDIRCLRKSFGDDEVLRGLDLRIPEGQITSILGPSGAGKTVLIKHLVGLLEPDDGEVLIDGTDLWELSAKKRTALCARMGVLFQDGALFGSLDIYDNTAVPLREKSRRSGDEIHEIVMDKLTLVGLGDSVRKMPNEISGGMRKRAALARALVTDPPVVLLDEPDSGLDPVRASLLTDILLAAHEARRATYVVVTHNIDTARAVSDRVVLTWQGRAIHDGTVEEIFAADDSFVRQFLAGDTAGPLTMN